MAEKEQAEKLSKERSNNASSKLEYNNTRLISVEFPGSVNNPDHLMQCLGGEDELTKVFNSNTRRLAMTFRPEDPYSKIVCGDRNATTSLLLRVRRRKKKNSIDGTEENQQQYEYKQEVVGAVDTTYRFTTLADYQYLTHDADYPLCQIKGIELIQEKPPRLILPTTFSRIEKPVTYHFLPDIQPPQQSSKVDPDNEQERQKASKLRKRNQVYALAVSFKTKEIPVKPHNKASEGLALVQGSHLEAIQKLFNIRPIWSRMAIQVHMNVTDSQLKFLLAYVAYYWLNGPWRSLWIKIGYDPRKDPSSKIYQLVDYRFGARSVGRHVPIPQKKVHQYSIPALRRFAQGVSTVDLARSATTLEDKIDDKHDDDLPYVFTSNKLPVQKQVCYQLCDVHVVEVQQLISANDGQEEECHEKEGWLIAGTLDKIRNILVKHTLTYVESIKKDQPDEKDSDTSTTIIPWEQHEDVKSYLEMLEGDGDDIETYDIFGNDSDDDDEIVTTEIE